jgi:uncharacterized membrane protein
VYKRQLLAVSALVISFFFKVQAIALIPLLAYAIIATKSAKTVLSAGLIAVATSILVCLPFVLTGNLLGVSRVLVEVAGTFPRVSMYAFNLWWALTGGYGSVVSDETLVLGIPLAVYATAVYAGMVALILWLYSSRQDSDARWYTAALLAFAMFLFLPEMHERYLFPIFALLLPILPRLRYGKTLFFILSTTYITNLIYLLFYSQLADSLRPLSVILSLLNLLIFFGMIMLFRKHRHVINQES